MKREKYCEFLREQANRYFNNLECDCLYFINSGSVYIYPGGYELQIGYGVEMEIRYQQSILGDDE